MRDHYWVRVALDVPLNDVFDYKIAASLSAVRGQRVIVPFGRQQQMIGVVIEVLTHTEVPEEKQKDVIQVLDDLPAFSEQWLAFCAFAGNYYLRPIGEVILPVIAPPLRKMIAYRGKAKTSPVQRLDKKESNRRNKLGKQGKANEQSAFGEAKNSDVKAEQTVVLNDEQQAAVDTISSIHGYQTILLHGITGSGKTEVYLRVAEKILAQGKQVLFLVPEINLTPQFEAVLRKRFDEQYGENKIVVMHSRLSDGERLKAWVGMQRQEVNIVLGTRMSIFAPLENIGLIIVDEEHDASYKQQDGLRYSARDLAVWRAHQLNIPLVLGSATPSLESWQHSLSGKYKKVCLRQRAKATNLPDIRLINTKKMVLNQGLSPDLIAAISDRLARGEQAMVYLNRRGFAPVLRCSACAWTSECVRCSVHMVIHQRQGHPPMLQCHHCGYSSPIPIKCPDCGNQDLSALGYGTQRIEEALIRLFPQAAVQRIDADTTKRKGSAQKLFDYIHEGDVDIIVGTQMLAKGHDFKKLSLVGVLNADVMLFSGDFRASERLFSQLMQVSGRAGRHIRNAEVLLQTEFEQHALYQSLVKHDYEQFIMQTIQEREIARLPPFSYQVLISAQARQLQAALDFLQQIVIVAKEHFSNYLADIQLYDPVPLKIFRVANIERAQLLIESVSRPLLHQFMQRWLAYIRAHCPARGVNYFVEVDPLAI